MYVINCAVFQYVNMVPAYLASWTGLEELASELVGEEPRLDLGTIEDVLDLGLEARPAELRRRCACRLS
jgi:hypothetical protein